VVERFDFARSCLLSNQAVAQPAKPGAKDFAMKKFSSMLAASFSIAMLLHGFATLAHAGASEDTEIKALEDNYVKALAARDLDALMAVYENSPTLVVFDVIPPRQYVGWDAYKKDWQDVLAECTGPMKAELTEMTIVAEGNIGYGHEIQHLSCPTKGAPLDMTLRATDGYTKKDGKWLIAHEHLSAPIDLATGKGDLTSKP
jgi:ketosteroid isomerase-like protein